MKTLAFGLALLLGGAAFAQAPDSAYDGDGVASAAFETEGAAGSGGWVPTSGGQIVEAGNTAPERDARGIAVVSSPAVAPPGWNGTPADAMGGPELDAATGEPASPQAYPACTASITDKCLQTYERGRR